MKNRGFTTHRPICGFTTYHRVRGFTLIELLVVIAIISILASVVLASLNTARAKARDARRLADVRSIAVSLELYYDTHGHYPCSSPYETSEGNPNFLQVLVNEDFLSSNPQDPLNQSPYSYLYASWKTTPTGPCGQIVELDYDVENTATPCISGGKFVIAVTHCHIFIPNTVPCSDPWLELDPRPADCSALGD
jgi:prepilin-type N-terminal cleavage/methylation domain-containing protein